MCRTLDLGNGSFAIVCGDRSRPKHCACGREAVALCDWKVPARKSGTCDKPMCAQHAKQVGPEKHLCPEHQKSWDEWKLRHPPAQKSLFEPGSERLEPSTEKEAA